MPDEHPMFCKHCYANLNQATDSCCARCGREFQPDNPSSYLNRPFPSRLTMIGCTIATLILTTAVSFVVACLLALAQLKYIHSGH
jgi:predicted amidophosphoribosyltransferase